MKFGSVFLLLLAISGGSALFQRVSAGPTSHSTPVAANQRLTALSGFVIYVLLAAISVTVVDISGLLSEHFLVGILLIPPVLLKLGSTGYRVFRYYTGAEAYRLAGAPTMVLRFVVAPALVASTVIALASGVELWLFGLRFGAIWLPLHTASAVVMLIAVGAHLFAHLRLSIAAVMGGAMIRSSQLLSSRSLVAASLLLGAVLAVASLFYVSPFSQAFAGR